MFSVPACLRWQCIGISLLSLLPAGVVAQAYAPTDTTQLPVSQPARPDSSADIWDVYRKILHKPSPTHQSVGESAGIHPSIFPELAYALQTGFAVGATANISFTSANPEQNVSTIYTTPQYTQHHQIIIPLITCLWTTNNRYNIVSDWRYYDYSADDYGLGGYSPGTVDHLMYYSYLRLYQSVSRQIIPNLVAGLGYNLDYHWHIRDENKTPDLNNDYQLYGSSERSVSSGLTLSLMYSTRRNINNPEGGTMYASILFRPNFRFLGSDQNWQSLLMDFRKYITWPAGSRSVLGFWNTNWLTLGGIPPYLDLPSTGWDTYSNIGRGYTQGRFRGRNLIYLETEYRMPISRNGLLGSVFFANIQSYTEGLGGNFRRLLPGGGVGLRLKVNKHSNLNFALDYAVGLDGKGGVFVNLGEVF